MTQRTWTSHSILAAVLTCAGSLSYAQVTLKARPVPPPASIWPETGVVEGDRLLVVDMAQPDKKQSCKVKSIDADELVCGKSHGRILTFHKDDVAALITPARQHRWGDIAGAGIATAIGGAILYGAVLIATVSTPLIVVAIPVGLVGAVFGIGGPACLIFSFHEPGSSEKVLYQREGQSLQVKLRS
jgi:hypothetical protein